MARIVFFSVGFSIVLLLISSLTVAQAQSSNVFQEEHQSHPFKVVVSLDYTEKQFREGVGKISVTYEDSSGFKKIKYYNFDSMVKRYYPDPVKVKAQFPRNTISDFMDYLVCVTTLKNNHDFCVNDSRSPNTDKERIHIAIPS